MPNTSPQAYLILPTDDLSADMAFFQSLGLRLDQIYPADHPCVAVLSGFGVRIKLDCTVAASPATLQLTTEDEQLLVQSPMTAPNGTTILLVPPPPPMVLPPTQHQFEVRQLRDSDPWIIGRAGMLYRDLIPGRLGGSIIASHIRIPNGGPVPDMVHYHTIGFQLIYCYHGWVKLVYEDQGPPFILHAGDCVTQPPEIRHRVLEASDNLEVIEIGVPAVHMTTIDHDMNLPNDTINPQRTFQGQTFCHHDLKNATWQPWQQSGFEYRNTGIEAATKGVASVHVIRTTGTIEQTTWMHHEKDIYFTFILSGNCNLSAERQPQQTLKQGDAFVIPPGLNFRLMEGTADLELLEVVLT